MSLVVPLLFSFMYSFLPYLSFSTVRHFVLPAISYIILFFTFDINFSFTSFFHNDFFYLLLCLCQSPRFLLSSVLFCRKCCCNFLFLFFYHLLDFSFFIAIFYVMMQHQCFILYSLFYRPYSCFHQYTCGCCTDWRFKYSY